MSTRIYLDHAASAPIAESVLNAMQACLREREGNPAARYASAARARIATANEHIGALVGAKPAAIFYTSGATEADNWAMQKGVMLKPKARTVLTAVTEHAAILNSVTSLASQGYLVRWLPVNAAGLVEPNVLAQHLHEDVALVSLMLVNNETGATHDVSALAALCRSQGVPLHVDAAQAPGRVRVCFDEWGVDAMSLSAHKQHGPIGVGALLLREPQRWQALLVGGGQQQNLRSGTLAVHQIVGMGEAYRLALEDLTTAPGHFAGLAARLWQGLQDLGGVSLHAAQATRSPHIVSCGFNGVDGEALHAYLQPHLAVSLGSACHSDNGEPSRVLKALGLTDPQMAATVRFSFGRDTSSADVDQSIAVVSAALQHLRRLTPSVCGG
jgi:cysteine desulfurase